MFGGLGFAFSVNVVTTVSSRLGTIPETALEPSAADLECRARRTKNQKKYIYFFRTLLGTSVIRRKREEKRHLRADQDA